eukprot:11357818-Karenia_brevis.AAC.1
MGELCGMPRPSETKCGTKASGLRFTVRGSGSTSMYPSLRSQTKRWTRSGTIEVEFMDLLQVNVDEEDKLPEIEWKSSRVAHYGINKESFVAAFRATYRRKSSEMWSS